MGAGHAHALYVHEHSVIHRLPAEVKLVAVVVFVVAVAVTPREAVWAFAVYAGVLATALAVARVRSGFVATRLLAILPFVAFALLLPFIASGEKVDLLGLHVSVPGLWASWNILAKASLGASASILLTATTEVADILEGMAALRAPLVLTSIAGFMIRYLEIIVEELGRMRMAMTARGYRPRWVSQIRPIASSAGATFVRSYERGERVHGAMLSRGFTGVMPRLGSSPATAGDWIVMSAVLFPVLTVAVMALVIT
ncbi:MAG: cobalt ECF transporter T component CbiQ [Acidimicrobiia bacterium]